MTALEELLLRVIPQFEELSVSERQIFLSLLAEWQGSLEELVIAARLI